MTRGKYAWPEITSALVRELLDYEPATGALVWKRRDRRWFVSDNAYATWNTRFADKPAFAQPHNGGHLCGQIFYKTYLAHRIIWLWQTGRWPDLEIDHIDHDRTNNRWKNLREATDPQQAQNQSLPCNNTSGQIGVNQHKSKWQAHITVDGQWHYLGLFEVFEQAVTARRKAERQYGFHRNHGSKKQASFTEIRHG